MNIRQLRDKTYDYPHRCNDADLSYALDYIQDLQDSYKELDDKYTKLLMETSQQSRVMAGNMLGLLLNKPELLYTAKETRVNL